MNPILTGSSRHASGVARTLARDLAASGIPCTLSRAQETVARMFGHRDWHALSRASKGRPATQPDSEVCPAEAAARRDRFVAVLAAEFAIPPAGAARIVDAVSPTGRRQVREAVSHPAGYPALDKAIMDGATVRAFRSGGGLRVIRVERGAQGTKLIGYGEAPQIAEALRHADDDTGAGGRPYGEVYGRLTPHYLTGAAPAEDPLDQWVFEGHGLRARRVRGRILVGLSGSRPLAHREEIHDLVLSTGLPQEWEDRGMRYRMAPSGYRDFVSYECIRPSDDGRDPYTAQVLREASADTLAEALLLALQAPEREVMPDAVRG